MAIRINTVTDFQKYFLGVMGRSEHHAENVRSIILTLAGAVLWRNTGTIWVREFKGGPANILWFFIDGKKYALTYDHELGAVWVRDRTLRGRVLEGFDNASTPSDVYRFFKAL